MFRRIYVSDQNRVVMSFFGFEIHVWIWMSVSRRTQMRVEHDIRCIDYVRLETLTSGVLSMFVFQITFCWNS